MSADREPTTNAGDIEVLRPGPLAGNYASFADAVFSQLSSTQFVPERQYALPDAQTSLVAVRTDSIAPTSLLDSVSYHAEPDSELVRGFVDAWSAVGEVLSFYQGKFARIGYLRTAPDRASLRHLARGIGLPVQPAVSAETVVTFEVQQTPGNPAPLTIPKGQPLMGVAGDGSAALQFHTLADVVAESGWNEVSLASGNAVSASRKQPILTSTRQLFLQTLAHGLAAGDTVAVHERGGTAQGGVYAGIVGSVTVDASVSASIVTLLDPLAWQGSGAPRTLVDPIVFRFVHDLPLWGSDAVAWDALSPADQAALAPIRQGVARWNAESRRWERTATGLPAADILALAEDPTSGTLWAATPSGLYRLARGSSAAQPPAPGIAKMAYRVLLQQNGALYAAGSSGSVVQSLDAGRTWRRLQGSPPPAGKPQTAETRLPECAVLCLAYAQGLLFAGTDAGVFVWAEGIAGWREWNSGLPGYSKEGRKAQASVYALVFDASVSLLYAATDAGVFRGTLKHAGWEPFQTGLPTHPVSALTPIRAAVPPPGTTSEPAVQQSASPVQSLTLVQGATGGACLLAATMKGIYRRRSGEAAWTAVGPLPGQGVTSLTSGRLQGSQTVFAATENATWQSTDLGTNWQPLGRPGEGATTLLTDASSLWKAGAYLGSAARDWPDMPLADDCLETTATLPLLQSGTLALLTEPGSAAFAFDVGSVSVESRAQFGRKRQVTVVSLAPAPGLLRFSRRTARLAVQPVPLELKSITTPEPRLRAGAELTLAPGSRTLNTGRRVVVTGSPSFVILSVPAGEIPALQCDDMPLISAAQSEILAKLPPELAPSLDLALRTQALSTALMQAGIVSTASTRIEAVVPGRRWCVSDPKAGAFFLQTSSIGSAIEVVKATVFRVCACVAPSDDSSSTEKLWTLASPSSETFTLRAATGQITAIPAPADAAVLAAEYTVASANTSTIVLDRPLDCPLDPATITVLGNVGTARHGFAVSDEVLGSGSSLMAFQKFTLAHTTPLTQSASGAASGLLGDSLRIRVTGGGLGQPAGGIRTQAVREAGSVTWQQVPTFQHSTSTDLHFVVGVDHQNRTFVLFGDGTNGSRLPTGINNVRADYLTGAGSIGNIPAGNLRSSMRLPGVVVRSGNPMDGHGGMDAPPVDDVRARIHESSNMPRRIVVAADAVRFALGASQNIARADGRMVTLAHRPTLVITVATKDQSPASPLLPDLRARMLAAGAPRSLQLVAAKPIALKLEAEIQLIPQADADETLTRVQQDLQKHFGYAPAVFGRAVYAAQLIAVIQGVDGVASCTLLAFYRNNQARTLEQEITTQIPAADLDDAPVGQIAPPAPMLFLEPTPTLTLGGTL